MRRIRRFGTAEPFVSNRVRIFDCVNVLDGGVAIYSTSQFYNAFGVSDGGVAIYSTPRFYNAFGVLDSVVITQS